MSKFFIVTTHPDAYFINGVKFTNTLFFRTAWSLLEDFEKAYTDQLKKIPQVFIHDLQDLVKSTVRTETAAYNLLLTFQNEFDLHPKIQDFRIPQTVGLFLGDDEAVNLINKKLEANAYKFQGQNKYHKDTPTEVFLKDHGLYKEVFDLFVDDEVSYLLKHPKHLSEADYQNLGDEEYRFYETLGNQFEQSAFIYGTAFARMRAEFSSSLEYFEHNHGLNSISESLEFDIDGDYYIFNLDSLK